MRDDHTYDLLDTDEFYRRIALVMSAFSPSTPITSKQLFRGRTSQLNRLLDVSLQRGQHALVYGERGVGKTSLAKITSTMRDTAGALSCYYTCNTTDSFESIWSNILDEVQVTVTRAALGFNADVRTDAISARELLGAGVAMTPADVRRSLNLLSSSTSVHITVDEFDRLSSDARTSTLMADLIKTISDEGLSVTVVLVGVGDTVTDVMRQHESVARSLVQIKMPTMTPSESAEIVTGGMSDAEMEVTDPFVKAVVALSQGFPHYTHLLAQHAARLCVDEGRLLVTGDDTESSVERAMVDVSQSIRADYVRATRSHRETLHRPVLLACALAQKDELGEFGSADIRGPLRELTGRSYGIPAFSSHLSAFAGEGERGGILRKSGSTARFRYRFRDPLLPPFVRMQGLADGFDLVTH